MNAIKQFWAWLTGLFASDDPTRPVEQTKPAEHPQDVVQPRPKPAEPTPQEEPIYTTAEQYGDMSYFELNPKQLRKVLRNPSVAADIRRRVETADYAEMARHYSDAALDDVREYGTEFAYTPEIAKAIKDAVQTEWGIRRDPSRAPKGHGMGGETPSQPSGYVRKTGAGGGLDSWAWVRKDRGPTAAEEQAIREFQAKLDRQA